jgi:2'-5' RNA ligase
MALRLFVAIYPPPQIAAALLEAIRGLDLPPHRPVPPEQVHMTLQFIGDTAPEELDAVVESVGRAGGGLGPFSLQPQRLVRLPERGPARLVAAESDGPATLLELQRRLALRLAHGGARQRPGEGFRPHLTLCRFRSPRAMRPLDHPLHVGCFAVERFVLMRSTLRPSGAEHEEVASFPFAGP